MDVNVNHATSNRLVANTKTNEKETLYAKAGDCISSVTNDGVVELPNDGKNDTQRL
jgi:hypothetical protein